MLKIGYLWIVVQGGAAHGQVGREAQLWCRRPLVPTAVQSAGMLPVPMYRSARVPLHFEIGGTFGLIPYFCTLSV